LPSANGQAALITQAPAGYGRQDACLPGANGVQRERNGAFVHRGR